MELIFNELSALSLSSSIYEANEKMVKFANTVAVARKKNFRNIRSYLAANEILLSENYSLYDWLHNKDVPELYRSLLYGMIIQPFIREEDEVVAEQYIASHFYFEDNNSGITKTECTGLASAFLYETLSISLSSLPIWNEYVLQITIECDTVSTEEKVFNVSTKEAFENDELSLFVESLGNLELVETSINPEDKKVHLSDHHGKAELSNFSKRLILNEYVEEIKSTDWGGKEFIRKTYKNGIIEIVLTKSARNYALWVQTTGRNMRETIAISKILKDKFS